MIESSGLFSSACVVQAPRALSYDPDTHTLIVSDLKSTRMLSEVLCERLESGDPIHTSELLSQIGAALGHSLGRYHKWSSLPEQAGLRAQFLGNDASKKDALATWYQDMRKAVSRFGLKRDWMDVMIRKGLRDAEEGGMVIAMGDVTFSEFKHHCCLEASH